MSWAPASLDRAPRLFVAAWIASFSTIAGASELQLDPTRPRCDRVRFGGDIATCATDHCVLNGAVYLFCDNLRLWGDELKISWDEAHQFAGAEAQGNVLLVDDNTVVHCEHVTVDRDRIRGRIDDALVEIREGGARDPRGVPTGKRSSILHGDIERPAQGQMIVRQGSYTLCDCGADPPSWHIEAPEIDIALEKRATIWWPMLYVRPFGLGPVPVTPPLLPISLPLQQRALGFLPPAVTFYGAWPTIDVPLFVPLGRSWDITISAGLRTDWIRKHDLRPSRWGAPRLGGRLRYAPLDAVSGELAVQWTWDRRRFLARQYGAENDIEAHLQELASGGGAAASAGTAALAEIRRYHALAELEHRVQLTWQQRVDFTDTLRWQSNVEWLSDDRIRRDFGLTLGQQVANYIPSRTQLLWTPAAAPVGLVASLAADHLLAIGNNETELVNIRGAELHVPHRGPAARITLLPTAVAPDVDVIRGLHIDADADATRYGPWDPSDPIDLVIGGGEVGLSYMSGFGPLSLRARASGHGLWAEAAEIGTSATAFVHLQATAEATWARRFGRWIHTMTPRLRYAAIPDLRRSNPRVASSLRDHADEHLDIRKFHQGMVEIDQGLYAAGPRQHRVATLTVGLPFDLRDPQALALLVAASWRSPSWGSGSAWAVVDPSRHSEPLQELGALLRWSAGPITLATTYLRFAPTAERFNRSIYALAGRAAAAADTADWVHSIVLSTSYHSERVHLAYTGTILLRRPGEAMLPDSLRPQFSQHRLSAGYRSACDCWEIAVTGSIPGAGTAQEILDQTRLQVTFSVAGWALGNRL